MKDLLKKSMQLILSVFKIFKLIYNVMIDLFFCHSRHG